MAYVTRIKWRAMTWQSLWRADFAPGTRYSAQDESYKFYLTVIQQSEDFRVPDEAR